VVIDSVDWLIEPLIVSHVESNNEAKDLAYGKGQMLVAEEFREILQGLDVLRHKRGMNVVLIAHAAVVRFEDPRTEPYDRYQPKLHARASALVQEHVDAVLFANYRITTLKSDAGFGKKVVRGVSGGDRLLHTVERPAFLAKNRFGLPETLPLSWPDFAAAVPFYANPSPRS
jgi:hypothetical protein